MKHARDDYQQIQDPSGKIPEDEPVFLLRAQDKTAPAVVVHWALQAQLVGAEKEVVDSALDQAKAMSKWQREHGMKTPDLPGG